MSEYILRVENIKKSFVGVKALKNMDLKIKKGEIHSLAGENGCGKSTLIKIISGFYTADEGCLEINGNKYTEITTLEAIQEGIQVIYQDFSIFPNLSVMENLAINFELMNKRKLISYKRLRETARKAINTINFKVDLDEIVENLSVVEKQMIAICRALLYDAKLIIMDEPTTSLNKNEVNSLFKVIKSLQKKGIAILFVSHKLDEVFEISERYTIMRNGERIVSGETQELNDSKFAYYMTGRHFTYQKYQPANLADTNVLEVESLSLEGSYRDINFSMKQGEILGITGLHGSGRSEIMLTLFGVKSPDSGKIKINGELVSFNSVKDAIKHGVGYVPSDRLTEGLFLTQSITNNIAITELDRISSRLLGVIDDSIVNKIVAEWINKLSVKTNDPDLPVQALSGGNQQKVVLAKWLTQNLKVLILNGPTVGVDIGAKFDIYKIIRDLAASGLAVIIISDDLTEVINNCNRILVVKDGQLSKSLKTKNVDEKQLSELVY